MGISYTLFHRWYHGSIKRDVACMRLQAMSKPGAYLIRKSESEPGNYVLSFLDKQLRVFNYKISCRNGQYNVSGQSQKWFSSLQALIGYYTRFSTVKQNQHLDVPVAPPEVSNYCFSNAFLNYCILSPQVVPLPF